MRNMLIYGAASAALLVGGQVMAQEIESSVDVAPACSFTLDGANPVIGLAGGTVSFDLECNTTFRLNVAATSVTGTAVFGAGPTDGSTLGDVKIVNLSVPAAAPLAFVRSYGAPVSVSSAADFDIATSELVAGPADVDVTIGAFTEDAGTIPFAGIYAGAVTLTFIPNA